MRIDERTAVPGAVRHARPLAPIDLFTELAVQNLEVAPVEFASKRFGVEKNSLRGHVISYRCCARASAIYLTCSEIVGGRKSEQSAHFDLPGPRCGYAAHLTAISGM